VETALPGATSPSPHKVLIVGPDQAVADRFVPLLRRSSFEIQRMIRASGAQRLIGETAFDLILMLDPVPQAGRFIDALRSEGSLSRTAGLLLLTDDSETTAAEHDPRVNRTLRADCDEDAFERAVAGLLDVKPRFEVRAWVRLRVTLSMSGSQLLGHTVNVSESGMLLRGCKPLPVGASVDFELVLGTESRPIRGAAEIVRHAALDREPEGCFAPRFLRIEGDGATRLRAFLLRWRRAGAPVARAAGGGGAALKRRELEALEERLKATLSRGLMVRLRNPEWYLTGVELGLESLGAFYRISELVYRTAEVDSAGAQRVANLEKVYRRLSEFAASGEVAGRVIIMLEIRPQLEQLLAELEGTAASADAPAEARRRRTAVARLTGDVSRLMVHLRSLRALHDEARALLAFKLFVLRWSRRQEIDSFYRANRAFAQALGFGDPTVLRRNRAVRAVLARTRDEISRVERRLRDIHGAIYAGRFRQRSTGAIEEDLDERKVFGVLKDVLAAGYEYLERAHSAYGHGLELTGTSPDLLRRVAELRTEVERLEAGVPETADSSLTPVSAPPGPGGAQ